MIDNTNPFSTIFNGSDPNVNAQLRQKIALAMMAKQRRYPKTFGEGLAAIGDSLGEIGMARRIEQQDAADTASAKSLIAPPAAPGPRAEADITPAVTRLATAPEDNTPEPAAPTMAPAPGSLPPTGEPGNTGATTFPPPYQPPPGSPPMGSPPAASAPPVEDPRRAIALAMLKKGQLGQPQSPQFAPAEPQGPPDPALAGDPRRAVALDMLRQGNLGQPQNRNFAPSQPGPDAPMTPQAMSFDGVPASQGANPMGAAPFAPAPPPPAPAPPPQQIRQAPPMQAAPAAQPRVPDAGYVMPLPKEPVAPAQVPMTPREEMLRKVISNNLNNPKVAELAQNELSQLQATREFNQSRLVEKYKDDMIQHRALVLEREKQLQAAPKDVREQQSHTSAERKARDEENVRAQFANMDPKQIFTHMEDSKKTATAAKEGLVAADMARKAINAGAITGLGADLRLNAAKLVTGLGLRDMGNDVANTESFRSYMAPLIASALKSTVGNQNISNSDREFAAAAAGGSIKLDGESIKRIIDFVGRASRETLNEHETKVGTLFGQNPQGRALFGVGAPPVEKAAPLVSKEEKSQHEAAQEWLKANPNDPRAPAVRKRLGM